MSFFGFDTGLPPLSTDELRALSRNPNVGSGNDNRQPSNNNNNTRQQQQPPLRTNHALLDPSFGSRREDQDFDPADLNGFEDDNYSGSNNTRAAFAPVRSKKQQRMAAVNGNLNKEKHEKPDSLAAGGLMEEEDEGLNDETFGTVQPTALGTFICYTVYDILDPLILLVTNYKLNNYQKTNSISRPVTNSSHPKSILNVTIWKSNVKRPKKGNVS